MLLDENGGLIEDVGLFNDEVKRQFEKCFRETMSNRPTFGGIQFKKVSHEDNVLLMELFSEVEIRT